MDGYKNEYNFVLAFNNKKVCELNPILQDLVYTVFSNAKDYNIIKSWRNHYDQKADIFIKIGNEVKSVSIKMGSRNSVHVESMKSFKDFLKEHNVPNYIIEEYLKFHYADGTTNNKGRNRLSTEEYKINNQKGIDNINEWFNKEKVVADAIDRFVLKGNNSNFSIDAIMVGTPNDFLWLSRDSIVEILMKKKKYCSSPHFSELICQPMTRCLNYNKKYEKYRNYIQIKWYGLFDNIIEQMNNNVMKNSDYNTTLNF